MQTQAEVKILGIDPDDFCACLSRHLASQLHAGGATVAVTYRGIARAPRQFGVTLKGLHLALQVRVSGPDNEHVSDAARMLFDSFANLVAMKTRSFDNYLLTPSRMPLPPVLTPRDLDKGKPAVATFDLNVWASIAPKGRDTATKGTTAA